MKLSIIVPVYNEEKTVSKVLDELEVLNLGKIKKEIVVVDDGSSDSTFNKVRRRRIKLLQHSVNFGKGAAIRTGIKYSTGDYIIIQDADLEYNPVFFKKLLAKIKDEKVDVVYGTRINRFPNKKYEKNPTMLFHYLANRLFSLILSLLYQTWITDIETCYKLIPAKALRKIKLSSNGFEIEVEITSKLLKEGYSITEVPIETDPRTYGEGKKFKTFRDGSRAFYSIFKYRMLD